MAVSLMYFSETSKMSIFTCTSRKNANFGHFQAYLPSTDRSQPLIFVDNDGLATARPTRQPRGQVITSGIIVATMVFCLNQERPSAKHRRNQGSKWLALNRCDRC